MRSDASLADHFGRRFPYVRLSLTDICNFRCSYCLPDGYVKTGGPSFLRAGEWHLLVQALAALGVCKIRLSGGEPTLRKDFLAIARDIAQIPNISKLALTTNGYRLDQRAAAYREAGIDAINISIDSLNTARFHALSGHDRLEEILRGIETCIAVHFRAVKINSVLHKSDAQSLLKNVFTYIQDRPVSWRFIELMRTGNNAAYFARHHVSGMVLEKELRRAGWQEQARGSDDGPARTFAHPDFCGTIGLIMPYAPDFCASCNRLRISARGELHLCLFGEIGFPLRPLLQSEESQKELMHMITKLLRHKKASHDLHAGNSGLREHLASIGG